MTRLKCMPEICDINHDDRLFKLLYGSIHVGSDGQVRHFPLWFGYRLVTSFVRVSVIYEL